MGKYEKAIDEMLGVYYCYHIVDEPWDELVESMKNILKSTDKNFDEEEFERDANKAFENSRI